MKKTQIFYNTSNMYAQTHQPNSIQWVGFYISDRLGWKNSPTQLMRTQKSNNDVCVLWVLIKIFLQSIGWFVNDFRKNIYGWRG